MFRNAFKFKGTGLEKWKTSNVEDMGSMFYAAEVFNGDLSEWDTRGVKNMAFMFAHASAFVGGDLRKWNTERVETMNNMFYNASSFNGNVGRWSVGRVRDMQSMFSQTSAFTGEGLSTWTDISSVNNMRYMFLQAKELEEKPTWTKDIKQSTDTSSMFDGTKLQK
jgi:hypothetical protein